MIDYLMQFIFKITLVDSLTNENIDLLRADQAEKKIMTRYTELARKWGLIPLG